MNDFANFLLTNGLKRKDIASFLGVSGSFITQITNGDRTLPSEKLAMIKANAYGWDVSMLTPKANGLDAQTLVGREKELSPSEIRSALEDTLKTSQTDYFISYLEKKIENQDSLIRELYQKIGMLEAKLELARKGEIVTDADGSLSADAV